MHPRTYALTVAIVGIGFFLCVVGANLIIDPQAVFGTGLLGRSENVNGRYERLVAYQAAPAQYDGLLFGSSRARSIPSDELSRRLNGVKFADFTFDLGTLADHLPVLEYVVKDKASRREPLRAVLLLIDLDTAGLRPRANKYMQTLLPPAVTGENPARFWWKNLTAIQYQAWKSSIRAALGWTPPGGLRVPDWTRASRDFATEVLATVIFPPAHAEKLEQAPSPDAAPARGPRIIDNVNFPTQLQLLRRFVAICREHGITLIVMTSPLNPTHAAQFDLREIEEAARRMSRVVPLWYFSNPNWSANDPHLWNDLTHFHGELGQMMLQRIFDTDATAIRRDFGRLLPEGAAVIAQ